MTKRNGSEPILEVRNLQTHFFTDKGEVKAVKGVSFSLENKQMLGIVGESGCGKSVTAHSIMQLIKSPPGKIVDGEIVFRRQKRRVETIDIVQLDPKIVFAGDRDADLPDCQLDHQSRDGLTRSGTGDPLGK